MKTASHLDRHLQAHMEDKPYKCPYSGCQFSTKHKWSLQRHDIVHTKERKFPCTICEYRAAAKFRLTKHMRSHGAGTTTSTNKSFSSQSSHSSHSTHSSGHHKSSNLMTSSHPPAAAASSRYEERPFHCHLCKYKGKTQSHLSRHLTMKVHNRPEKSQPHSQTDYKSSNNSQAVHMGGHSGQAEGTAAFAGFPATTLNASSLFKVPVVPHCYPYGVTGNPYS